MAEEALARPLADAAWWNILGIARYRAGDWHAALAALNRFLTFQAGGGAWDRFYLAMAHRRLGHELSAWDWYRQACAEMDSATVGKVKLRWLRAEAAALLGVPAPADP